MCLVTPHDLVKSMMSAKSFYPPLCDRPSLDRWVDLMCVELYTRVMDDYEEHGRWPATVAVSVSAFLSEPRGYTHPSTCSS